MRRMRRGWGYCNIAWTVCLLGCSGPASDDSSQAGPSAVAGTGGPAGVLDNTAGIMAAGSGGACTGGTGPAGQLGSAGAGGGGGGGGGGSGSGSGGASV